MKKPTIVIIRMELENPLLSFGTVCAILALYFHRKEKVREKNMPYSETHN